MHSWNPPNTKIIKPITYTMTFYSWITSVPGIYMYQFSSPDKSTFLIRLLKELRLSTVLSFPGNLDQITRGSKYIWTQMSVDHIEQFRI